MITVKSSVAALVTLFFLSSSAIAALGGDEASVATDQVRMKASRRVFNTPQYTVHEIQTPSGTLVREYISAQGQVFAVAWKGPFLPDLQQILGSYFNEYGNAASSKHTRRGPVLVQQPGLVIQSGGHMRAFSGRAYIPLLLPVNMTLDEIQ
jgi:hypothetical protein